MRSSALGAEGAAHPRVVLASASPRRRDLIRFLVPAHDLSSSAVEDAGSSATPDVSIEPLPVPREFNLAPESHPALWAFRKAHDVAQSLPESSHPAIVIGADTVVLGRGQLLNKPRDAAEARAMLGTLRGGPHFVATGHVLLLVRAGSKTLGHLAATVSKVTMRDYDDAEVEQYVDSGEPLDKAGAYAIQGLGGALVSEIEGCYYNVVGFPLCDIRDALEAAGAHVLPRPAGGYCEHCPLRATSR